MSKSVFGYRVVLLRTKSGRFSLELDDDEFIEIVQWYYDPHDDVWRALVLERVDRVPEEAPHE